MLRFSTSSTNSSCLVPNFSDKIGYDYCQVRSLLFIALIMLIMKQKYLDYLVEDFLYTDQWYYKVIFTFLCVTVHSQLSILSNWTLGCTKWHKKPAVKSTVGLMKCSTEYETSRTNNKTMFKSTPKHICTTRSRLPLHMLYLVYWFIAPSILPFPSMILSERVWFNFVAFKILLICFNLVRFDHHLPNHRRWIGLMSTWWISLTASCYMNSV